MSLVFLLHWPLLMAAGCSSSVLMWKAAARVQQNFCFFPPQHKKKKKTQYKPVACLCFLLVVLTLPPSPPSLLPPRPTPPPPSERQSAPAGILDAGSRARRDGAATSLHSPAFSLSLAVSLSPPEHLLHHCSATINSSVQISCKLPK